MVYAVTGPNPTRAAMAVTHGQVRSPSGAGSHVSSASAPTSLPGRAEGLGAVSHAHRDIMRALVVSGRRPL